MRYLSVAEIAKKWNMSERSVRNYCAHGRVNGAFLTGKTWEIPEIAEKPERSNKKKEHLITLLEILQEQKKEILKKTGSLRRANYEFYFGNEIPRKENPMRKEFVMSVKIVEKLIKDAVEEGDFVCEDPMGAARNILYVLEGLKVSAETIGITEETVNREIYYWLKGLAYD